MFLRIHYYRFYTYCLRFLTGVLYIRAGHIRKEGLDMECKIGVISGDGIGPEIVAEAKKVLDKIGEKYQHTFHYEDILMGGCSIDAPWYKLAPELRPEAGLLKLRKSLNLFANLRPAYLYEELKAACPLRDDIIGDGFDMMIMRELTGGLYFGERKTEAVDGVMTATDTLTYNENEIRRIAKRGFDIAKCFGFLKALEKSGGGSGKRLSGSHL